MRLLREEKGQSTVLMALMMTLFILGFAALALDAGNLFRQKRMAQAAADAAAVAAGEEISGGNSGQNAANAIAKLNGFDTTLATNPATVTLNNPPLSGNYMSSNYVEAIVSKPVNTFFLSIFKMNTVTVKARAVAGANQGSSTGVCLTGGSGMDLNMSNDSKLNATGNGVTVDSSSSNAVGVVGSASLTAQTLGMVSSTWNESSNVDNGGSIASGTKIVTGLTTPCAPTAPGPPSYNSSQCTADPLTHYSNGGSSYAVGPSSTYSTTQSTSNGSLVCYTSLTVGSNSDTVTINPGIYVISGGELHFESGSGGFSNQGGNGVVFYLTNGASLGIDNGANVKLTAPSSGTYDGWLIYQDNSDTQPLSVQGGSTAVFNGAIYAYNAPVSLGNGSGSSFSAGIVAQTLTMNGGGTLTATPIPSGSANPTVSKLVE